MTDAPVQTTTSNPTVFHVTHWKAGSQWVRAVLGAAAPSRVLSPDHDPEWFYNRPLVNGGVYTPVFRHSREEFEDPTTGLIYMTDGNGGGLTVLRWTGPVPRNPPLPGAR